MKITTNYQPNNVIIKLKKNDVHAEITAHYKNEKIGLIELEKNNEQWNLGKIYVNKIYDKCGIVSSKMINKAREIKEDVNEGILQLLTYLEKD